MNVRAKKTIVAGQSFHRPFKAVFEAAFNYLCDKPEGGGVFLICPTSWTLAIPSAEYVYGSVRGYRRYNSPMFFFCEIFQSDHEVF